MALALQCLGEKELRLRLVMERPGLSASERLLAFMLELYGYMQEQFESTPRVNELVEAMAAERKDVIKAYDDQLRSLLVTHYPNVANCCL